MLKLEMHIICYGLCMTIYRCCYAEVGDAHYLLCVVYDTIDVVILIVLEIHIIVMGCV